MLYFDSKTGKFKWTKYKTDYIQQFGFHVGDIVSIGKVIENENIFPSYDYIVKKLRREDQRHWAYKDPYPNDCNFYEIIGIFDFDPDTYSRTNNSDYKYIFALREMTTRKVYLMTKSALSIHCSEYPGALK